MKEAVIENGQVVNIIEGHIENSLPLEDIIPTYDNSTHKVTGSSYIIEANKVVKNYTIEAIPADELLQAKRKQVETAVQNLLDTQAQEAGYDSIISACSYMGSTNFGAEAKSFLDWRDSVWTTVFQIEADVLAGTRTEPTIEELLNELPARL